MTTQPWVCPNCGWQHTGPVVLGLTPRQAECLAIIEKYIAAHGYAPSYDEIGRAIGTSSKGEVYRLLSALVSRGRLHKAPGRARSLTVVAA